jgi:hypothetical protein
MAEIRYIRGCDLDRGRWDRLMQSASNTDLFGSSVYLDTMADGWDAVVCGDYEAALPLPVRKRFGFRYTYILPFCGPFSVYGRLPEGVSVEMMLSAIPQRLLRCDLNLWTDAAPSGWVVRSRINHLLDLSMEYTAIRRRYGATCKNLLNRGLAESLQLTTSCPISAQLQMAGQFGGLGQTDERDVLRFERLCREWEQTGQLLSMAVATKDGRIIAGGVFLRSARQLHYLLGWSNREGKKYNASRHILGEVIQMHAGQPLTLDFEGSDIPGVAQFFESFGAVPKIYPFLRRDKLPALFHQVIKHKNQFFRKG